MIADLKPYTAYKDSGSSWLARVPAHWDVRNLRTLIRPRNERNRIDLPLLSVAREKGVFVRSMTDANENHNVIPLDLTNYKVARAGALVINKMKAWQGSMGIAPCDGIVSPAYYVFDFDIANRKFGQTLLRSKPYVAHFGQASDGVRVGQWDLTIAAMRQIPVLAPPPEEQAAIVRFLDWANAELERTIRAKRRVIALLTEQKQSIIHRAVTRGLDPNVPLKPSGIAWLGDIPAHWEVRRLGRLAKVFNGTTPSRFKPAYWSSGTIPWLASGKVNDRIVTSPSELITARAQSDCSLTLIPSGALVMGMVGQGRTRGMCAILAIDACINQNLAAIVSGPAILNQFLLNTLIASYWDIREFGRGGNQAALNCEIVGRLPVPVLPLGEQQAIVSHINIKTAGLNTGISRLNREIDLLREYRTRLVADVVTGKLDVREAAAQLPEEPLDTATVEDVEAEAPDEIEDEEGIAD